jgi:hydroxymethylbilane synthase
MLSISLRPNGRRAVIVGGGNAARRKAESLAGAGFPIFVVAERIDDSVRSILHRSGGESVQRAYEPHDVLDAALVIAATDDSELNARIVDDARAARALVCDASDPARGDFTMAATQRIGDLTISVDSGGGAPAFSQRVAREIASGLDARYGIAVRTLAEMRSYVKKNFEPAQRAPILRALAQRPIGELASVPRAIVCATRTSKLATVQSRSVAARLAERGLATTLLGVTTAGDRDRHTPIERLGEVNVFVKELELALRERRADYAVHSAKDLASVMPQDMSLAAISVREDPRDAFCSERYPSFESLPAGALVGTSSPRRRAQLNALRPDLRYEAMRGNVDTRLRKLAAAEYDAIVLAMAGLNRLRAAAAHVVPFAVDDVVPAAGQGALAVETRADDELRAVVREAVNDPATELCVVCERAALRALRAGCSAPLGVHARLRDDTMVAHGAYAPDGESVTRASIERPCTTLAQAESLGTELGERLRAGRAAATGVER